MSWIIPLTEPTPPAMTLRHGLYCLYALQQWESITQPKTGPYKPSYFYNALEGVLHGLERPSRQTALRHIAENACTICQAPLDITRSVLDHLMPTSRGGPDTLDNTCMLCPKCNSSKGAKDLLQWWADKHRNPLALDRRVLCLYARIYWQHTTSAALQSFASDALKDFLTTRAMHTLPSPQHQIALHGSAYAACALGAWLHTPQERGIYA